MKVVCVAAMLGVAIAAAGCAADSTSPASKYPAAPPKIVFDAVAAGGHREVYVVSLDGTGLLQLTSSTGDDVEPSAAAGSVVFTSWRDHNGELYSIGIDGTGERRLTSTKANETLPALAPDGHAIAYVSDASGVQKVWLASRDLSISAAATAPSFAFPGAIETSPAWSPASDKLLFVATANAADYASLFTESAQPGGAPSAMTGSGTRAAEVEPSWSADGQRVAFASEVSGVSQIFVRDLKTSAVAPVTVCTAAAACGQPTWLADGRIVYTILAGTTSSLAWVDPAVPNVSHAIVTGGLSAEHASAVRP